MNPRRIIVITGSPGTGKTTTASIVAKESELDKSVHMHTDDFFHFFKQRRNPAPFAGVQRTESGCDRSLPGSGKAICPWRVRRRCGRNCRAVVFVAVARPRSGKIRGTLHCSESQQRRNPEAGRGTLEIGQKNKCRPGGGHVGAVLSTGNLRIKCD